MSVGAHVRRRWVRHQSWQRLAAVIPLLVQPSCLLTSEPEEPARAIALEPVVSYLLPGGTASLRVQIVDAAGGTRDGKGAVFSSADITIATVSSSGVVTAKAPGRTEVVARIESFSASVDIEVLPDFGTPVTSVHTALVGPSNGSSCVLDAKGRASCWGENGSGQVGDGTATYRSAPVAVAGGLTFREISAGGYHTCGIAAGNVAWCWGENSSGRLGDGTTITRLTPTRVLGGKSFTRITTGPSHNCALDIDGQAWCWGSNGSGQLGVGSAIAFSTEPVAVATTNRFESLSSHYSSGGSATCGVTRAGKLWCWGAALPDAIKSVRYTPVDVSPPVAIRFVGDAGYRYSGGYLQAAYYCAVDRQRALWCATGRSPYSSGAAVSWQRQAGISAESLLLPGGGPCWLGTNGQAACAEFTSPCLAADYCSNTDLRIISGVDTLSRMPRLAAATNGTAGLFGIDSAGRLFEWDDRYSRPRLIVVR